MSHVDPERQQFETFKALPRDHPIEMLNLVRLRDRAAYPEGHALADAGLSGAEAERWDHGFIAFYPDAHAFLAMVTDPVYRSAVVHRQSAVATSRLIRCAPEAAGAAFG